MMLWRGGEYMFQHWHWSIKQHTMLEGVEMAQYDWIIIYKKTNDWRWVQRIRQKLIMINTEYSAKKKDYFGLKDRFDKNKARDRETYCKNGWEMIKAYNKTVEQGREEQINLRSA